MNKESGLSTIFVIGILTLLLCLGIAFITSSIIEKKASRNFVNVTEARIAARSALSRAMAHIKSSDTKLRPDLLVYSHNKSNENQAAELQELLFNLNTTVEGHTYKFTAEDFSANTDSPLSWIYISSSNEDTDRFISRIAYVVFSDSSQGDLDPSAIVDSSSKNGIHPSEVNGGIAADGIEVTMLDANGVQVIGRPGRNVSEIFLRSILSTQQTLPDDKKWFENTHIDKMSPKNSSGASDPKLPQNTRWRSFEELFTSLNIKNPNVQEQFKQTFTIYSPPLVEKFWIDDNDDNIRSITELYPRFNLSREKWDFAVKDIINAVANTELNTENTTYIPWLRNWKTKGGFYNKESCAKQITANIIDYCDSNDDVTTDDYNHPSYIGLEKVPYINEIRIKFVGSCEYNYQNKNRGDVRAQIIPEYFTVEAVNMYDTPGTVFQCIAQIAMSWEFQVDSTTYSRDDTAYVPVVNLTSKQYQQNTGQTFGQSWYYVNWTPTSTDKAAIGIKNLKIKSLKVKLIDSNTSKLYDYAYLNFDSVADRNIADSDLSDMAITPDIDVDSDLTITTFAAGDNVQQIGYFTYQAADPRQNFLPKNWSVRWDKSTDNPNPGTLGSVNSNFKESHEAKDTETALQPWDISTAYIRNAPMKSPWELGSISRGEVMQTLNIKKYNSMEGTSSTAGGNDYTDGDANILDQITMSSADSEYGKISVNTQNDMVLRALFEKVRIGSSLENPGSLTDNQITNDKAKTISSAIREYSSTLSAPLATRPEILKNSGIINALTTMTGQTNDRTQEEVIGKVINLTDASAVPRNIFYIIAIGESVKDISSSFDKFGNSINGAYEQFDSSSDEILATQKIFAVVARNPSDNKLTILRLKYISE